MPATATVTVDASAVERILDRRFAPFFDATAALLRALATAGPLPDEVMAAADRIRVQVAALGGRDIGAPPGKESVR